MEQYATMWLNANAQETVPNYWGWQSKGNLERMQQGKAGIYSTQYWGDIFIGPANRFGELFTPQFSQQHNLSVSGSSDKNSYRLSAGYANNRANLATAYDGQKQYNLRFNYGYDLSERVQLHTNISYQKSITSSPSSGISASLVAEDPPFFPAKNPYGEWYANFGTAGNRNSVAATTDGGRDHQTDNIFKADAKATIKLLEGLNLEGTASVQSDQYRQDMYQLTVSTYEWDGTKAPSSISPTSSVRAESHNTFYRDYSAILHYKKSFGDHNITAMAGVTAEQNDYKRLYGYRTDISDNGVYDLNLAGVDKVEATGGKNHWGIYSYISRLNYNYQGKYLVELLGRRDGSSRFAPGHRFSNFGNASAGWVVSNETFMHGLKPALSYLKLRASYGVTGNQVGIGLYDYLSTIGQGSAVFGNSPALQTSAWVNGMTSYNRTWEQVYMKNIGVDLGFLSDRLTGSFDYYQKQNKGMLISITYPAVLGATAPKTNAGKLNVHGWEAQLGWKDNAGQLAYNISVNMSDSRSKLVYMEGASTTNPGENSTVIGYPLNSYFMYQTDGYFSDQQAVDHYYTQYTNKSQGQIPVQSDQTQNLRPGDTKKIDVNGDGVIDQNDIKYMGDGNPHYTFGINLGASWKGFDFSAFFQGDLVQHIERTGWNSYPFYAVWTNPNVAYMGKTWTPNYTSATFPRLTVSNVRSGWDYKHNDFVLQNNRYIRLKSLIVGYTLPASITRKANINKLRFYFSGHDLWELTSIKDGYDPEQGATSQNSGYPFFRTWSLGVNIGF